MLSLLPQDLRSRSQSDREIVLGLDDALAASEVLEAQGISCAGWEGRVRDRDGGHFQHAGFPGAEGAPRQPAQPWSDHVRASWEAARAAMRADQARWNSGWTWPGEALFFLLRLATER